MPLEVPRPVACIHDERWGALRGSTGGVYVWVWYLCLHDVSFLTGSCRLAVDMYLIWLRVPQLLQVRAACQNNAVNASSKQNLRTWLLRTRRMYHAAGQSEGWDKRSVNICGMLPAVALLLPVCCMWCGKVTGHSPACLVRCDCKCLQAQETRLCALGEEGIDSTLTQHLAHLCDAQHPGSS